MDKKKLGEVAAEIARYVIEEGQVEGDVPAEIARHVMEDGQVEVEDYEWWLTSLGAAVLFEADVRGYENAIEIADEAVRLYSKGKPGSSGPAKS